MLIAFDLSPYHSKVILRSHGPWSRKRTAIALSSLLWPDADVTNVKMVPFEVCFSSHLSPAFAKHFLAGAIMSTVLMCRPTLPVRSVRFASSAGLAAASGCDDSRGFFSTLGGLCFAAAVLKSSAVTPRFLDAADLCASSVAVAISSGLSPTRVAAWEMVAGKRETFVSVFKVSITPTARMTLSTYCLVRRWERLQYSSQVCFSPLLVHLYSFESRISVKSLPICSQLVSSSQ